MYPADAGPLGQHPQQGPPPANRPWDSAPPQQGYQYPPHYHHQQPPPPPVNGSHPQQPPPPPREGQPSAPSTAPPSQIRPDRPEMAAIHHQYYPHQPPYLPAPASLYPPQQHEYRPPPPPQPAPQPQVQQSAPRQRTAIACKYCRRRKIRCSGFENSEDGRCSNCVRFSQECVFTPVSAQTQAFVPAQALYRRGGAGPPPGAPQQLYGPYGNRLPPQHDPYAHPPPPGQQPQYTLPSPTGPYPPPGQPYQYPPPPQSYPEPPSAGARRRGRDEPHTPTAPPPNAGGDSHMVHRDSYGAPPPGYNYPDPQSHSAGSPHAAPGYGQQPQPYYPGPGGPRRNSPGSNSGYSYDPSRDSHSPHSGPTYGYPPTSVPGQSHYTSGPPPSSGPQRTPPPLSATDRGRSGMSIHDMVSGENGPSSGERSAADSSMVSALNRPTKR